MYDKRDSYERHKQLMACVVRQIMDTAWAKLAVLDDATLGDDAHAAEEALHLAVYSIVEFLFMSKHIDGNIEYALSWKRNRDVVARIYATRSTK